MTLPHRQPVLRIRPMSDFEKRIGGPAIICSDLAVMNHGHILWSLARNCWVSQRYEPALRSRTAQSQISSASGHSRRSAMINLLGEPYTILEGVAETARKGGSP